jgi:hypothetical protein
MHLLVGTEKLKWKLTTELGLIAGGIDAEEKVKEKYATQGIDLSKGQQAK